MQKQVCLHTPRSSISDSRTAGHLAKRSFQTHLTHSRIPTANSEASTAKFQQGKVSLMNDPALAPKQKQQKPRRENRWPLPYFTELSSLESSCLLKHCPNFCANWKTALGTLGIGVLRPCSSHEDTRASKSVAFVSGTTWRGKWVRAGLPLLSGSHPHPLLVKQ